MDGEEPLRPILQEKKSQPRKIITRKRRRPFGRGEAVHLDFISIKDFCISRRETLNCFWHSQILRNSNVVNRDKGI